MAKTDERRYARKNEEIMMGKIDSIISVQAQQSTDIAVIKSKSESTEEHLKTLNSKVALQEGRQQATDTAVSLNSEAIKILMANQRDNVSFLKDNWKVLLGAILSLVIAYILRK